jgi:hypothetical protein
MPTRFDAFMPTGNTTGKKTRFDNYMGAVSPAPLSGANLNYNPVDAFSPTKPQTVKPVTPAPQTDYDTLKANEQKANKEYQAALQGGLSASEQTGYRIAWENSRKDLESAESAAENKPLVDAYTQQRTAEKEYLGALLGGLDVDEQRQYKQNLEGKKETVNELGGNADATWYEGGAQQYVGNMAGALGSLTRFAGAGELEREAAQSRDAEMAGALREQANTSRTEDTNAIEKFGKDTVQKGAEQIEAAKSGRSAAEKILVDLGVQAEQMAFDAALGAATGGGFWSMADDAAGKTVAQKLLRGGLVPMGARSFGGGVQEAEANGATKEGAALYGVASAAVEIFTEKMFNGFAGIYGKGSADNMVNYIAGKLGKGDMAKRAWGLVFDGLGEGAEEAVADLVNPIIKSIYNGKSIGKNFSNLDAGEIAYDTFIGTVLGFAGGAVNLTGRQSEVEKFFMDASDKGMSFKEASATFAMLEEVTASIETNKSRRESALNALSEYDTQEIESIQTNELLGTEKGFGKAASGILRDGEKLALYTKKFGAPAGSNTEKVAQIANSLYEHYRSLHTPVPAANEQNVTEPTIENATAPAETVQNTVEQNSSESVVESFLTGKRNFAGAKVIADSEANRAAFEKYTSLKLDGSRKENVARIMSWKDNGSREAYKSAMEYVKANPAGVDAGDLSMETGIALSDANSLIRKGIDNGDFIMREDGSVVSKDAEQVEKPKRKPAFAPETIEESISSAKESKGNYKGYEWAIHKSETIRGIAKPCFVEIALPADRGTIIIKTTDDAAASMIANKISEDKGYKAPKENKILSNVDLMLGAAPTQTATKAPAAKPLSNVDLLAGTAPQSAPAAGKPTAPVSGAELLAGTAPTTAAEAAPAQSTEPAAAALPSESTVRANTPMHDTAGDSADTRTSNVFGSAMESGVTPESFKPLLDTTGENGGFNYAVIHNDATLANAEKTIMESGWDKAHNDWVKAIYRGEAGDKITAMGLLFYNNAVNSGNRMLALDILTDLKTMGGNAGRAVQVFSLFNKLSPENRLYMIQSSVQKAAAKLNLPDGITISTELAQAYLDAASEQERNTVVGQMQAEVASQIPATFMDKLTALRYLNMLGNLKTQVRNVGGNVLMQGVRETKNAVQTLSEAVLNKVSGGKVERTTSILTGEYMAAAYEDAKGFRDALLGNKFSESSAEGFMRGVEDKREIFSFKPLEWYRNITNFAMDKGDLVFNNYAYARALGGFLKAQGMSAEVFNSIISGEATPTGAQAELIERGRALAIKEAQESTSRDTNAVSSWFSKLGRGEKSGVGKFFGTLLEGAVPFRKTPANILVRAEEYSPLGLVNTTYEAYKAAKGEASGTDVVNSLSKTLTGTGLFALGMALRAAGRLNTKDDDSKQESFDKLQGGQDYAILMNDGKSVTIDNAAPACIPMFMGAEIYDALQEVGSPAQVMDALFRSVTDPLIEMSMLQGIQSLIESASYAEEGGISRAVGVMASGYLTQFMTNTLLGQLERTMEPERMQTFVDKNSDLPAWIQRSLGKATAKIPGVDYNQIPYIDEWGRRQQTGSAGQRAVDNFLNPSYVSENRSTATDKELQRLYDGGFNVLPGRADMSAKIPLYDRNGNSRESKYMSAEEYVTYAETKGKTAYDTVTALMNTVQYKAASDEQKAQLISKAYELASNSAVAAVTENYPGETAEALKKKGISPAAYICVQQQRGVLGTTIANTLDAVLRSGKTAAEQRALCKAFLSDSAFNKYLDVLNSGKSVKAYVKFMSKYYNTSGKNSEGKTVNGLRKTRMLDWAIFNGYTEADAEYFYSLMN